LTIEPRATPKVLELYLEISRYPILARKIRERMRQELFARHVIAPETFEQEVREKAIHSQYLEGLEQPFEQESPEVWQERVRQIRDGLTDFYFAYNLPHDLFAENRQVCAPGPQTRQGDHPNLQPGAGALGYAVRQGRGVRGLSTGRES